MTLDSLTRDVCNFNRALLRLDLVTWTNGNVSGRMSGVDLVVIKPSGIHYEELTPHNMVIIPMEGPYKDFSGSDMKPSVDTESHLEIYRAMPTVGGICHTHSPYATAVACMTGKMEIPCFTTEMADLFGGPVPITSRVQYGRDIAGEEVLKLLLASNSKTVLLRHHGVITVGKNPEEAVKRAVAVENAAKIYLSILFDGRVTHLPEAAVKNAHERYENLYGQRTDH